MRRYRNRWWQGLVLVLLAAACTGILYLRPYQPDQAAQTAMQGGGGITVTDTGDWLVFEGGQVLDPGIIFYPGPLAPPECYAPVARLLAGDGYRVFIAQMPLNLAVSDSEKANQVLKAYPKESFVIGGHSQGGAMAARFAANHPERVRGVFILGAYPDKSGNLKDTKLPVLSLLGSRDGVVNREKYEWGKTYLPEDAVYMTIEGGNHAQFGSYGPQKGDQPAVISPQEQWQQTAAALVEWLRTKVAASPQ